MVLDTGRRGAYALFRSFEGEPATITFERHRDPADDPMGLERNARTVELSVGQRYRLEQLLCEFFEEFKNGGSDVDGPEDEFEVDDRLGPIDVSDGDHAE